MCEKEIRKSQGKVISLDNVSSNVILRYGCRLASTLDPPDAFHLLVALADRDLREYAIMQDVAARTNGKLRLSPGTLYGSIKRLLEQGLIIELENDARRRYYRLTPFGRRVAKAEASRKLGLVDQARQYGFAR